MESLADLTAQTDARHWRADLGRCRLGYSLAHIKKISPESAEGPLRAEYDAAVQRAGRVWNILKVMSLAPRVLKASMGLYGEVMFGPSPLSRAQREMMAVVVSKANACHY